MARPDLAEEGGPPTAAMLNQPTNVVSDVFGNVYIADHHAPERVRD
jgi:hypothetical protein